MAEVVLRELARGTAIGPSRTLADVLVVSSVGTGPWHVGEPMDPRAREALARRDYDGDAHVAQQVDDAWSPARCDVRVQQDDVLVLHGRQH